MNRVSLIIITALIFSQATSVSSQNDSLNVKYIEKTKTDYRSFELVGDTLFAINNDGKVVIWDLKKIDTINFRNNGKKYLYTSICRDKHNNIYLGTNTGKIYKLDPKTLSFSFFKNIRHFVYDMCFNSEDKLFTIIPFSIFEPSKKRHWKDFSNYRDGLIHKKRIWGLFWVETDTYFTMPEYSYLDKKDRWWMYRNYGEWGSKIQIFDTKNECIYSHVFDSIQKWHLSPKSIFEDNNGNVFISSGIQHICMWGEITKIDSNNNESMISIKIENEIQIDTTIDVEIDEKGIINVIGKKIPLTPRNDLFIGPAAYNPADGLIYFSTQNGFYTGKLNPENKLDSLINIFEPVLLWNPEPMAVGYQMAIKEVLFTHDNRLLFQTANNGFGIYKNNNLIMFR